MLTELRKRVDRALLESSGTESQKEIYKLSFEACFPRVFEKEIDGHLFNIQQLPNDLRIDLQNNKPSVLLLSCVENVMLKEPHGNHSLHLDNRVRGLSLSLPAAYEQNLRKKYIDRKGMQVKDNGLLSLDSIDPRDTLKYSVLPHLTIERYTLKLSEQYNQQHPDFHNALDPFEGMEGDVNATHYITAHPVNVLKSKVLNTWLGLDLSLSEDIDKAINYEWVTPGENVKAMFTHKTELLNKNGLLENFPFMPQRYIDFVTSTDSQEISRNRVEFLLDIFKVNDLRFEVPIEIHDKESSDHLFKVDKIIKSILHLDSPVIEREFRDVNMDVLSIIDKGQKIYQWVADKMGVKKLSRAEYLESVTVDRESPFHFNMHSYKDMVVMSKLDDSFTKSGDIRLYDHEYLQGDQHLHQMNKMVSQGIKTVAYALQSDEAKVNKDFARKQKACLEWFSNKPDKLKSIISVAERLKADTFFDYNDILTDFANGAIKKALTMHRNYQEDWFRTSDIVGDFTLLPTEEVGVYQGSMGSHVWSPQSPNAKSLLEMNAKLHLNQHVFDRVIAQSRGVLSDKPWVGLLKEPFKQGDYVFEPVNSELKLLDEATALRHCAFSYESRCKQGDTDIISMRRADNNERVATLQVTPHLSNDKSTIKEFELVQAYGYKNEKLSPLHDKEVAIFVHKLQCGLIDVNIKLGLSSKSTNEEVILTKYEEIARADRLSRYPSSGEGGYIAAILYEKYTPDNHGILSVLEKVAPDMARLIKATTFFPEVEAIKNDAKKQGLSTMAYIEKKLTANESILPILNNSNLTSPTPIRRISAH